MKDSDLLVQFVQGSEPAFAELVLRHVDLVFAAALRHVAGDHHRAEDITQQVFIDLARKGRKLTGHPTLAGWLYASTRYAALNTLRHEQRRAAREKQSEIMNTTAVEPRWEQIRPVIDEALQELDEEDRQSVLLRFFGGQPFAAVAVQLGISENAAQKRVDRALDRLGVALKRRGISSTAVALGAALGNASVTAPATLTGTVTTAAFAHASGAAAGASALVIWFKGAIAMAAVGVIGWAGLRWAEPPPAEPKPVSPAGAALANPPAVVAGPAAVTGASAPEAIAPLPASRMTKSEPPPAPARQIYVIRSGDTLKRIAKFVGVTPDALSTENPGFNPAKARVGDQLQLPVGAVVPPPPQIPADEIYVVEPGDTLQSIALKRDILPGELRALNPGTDWQKLQTGQKVRAP